METLIHLAEKEVLTLAFCFALVFVAGIAFGYINGYTDGKTAPPKFNLPKYENPPKPPEDFNPRKEAIRSGVFGPAADLEKFEKEYRREVLGTRSKT